MCWRSMAPLRQIRPCQFPEQCSPHRGPIGELRSETLPGEGFGLAQPTARCTPTFTAVLARPPDADGWGHALHRRTALSVCGHYPADGSVRWLDFVKYAAVRV